MPFEDIRNERIKKLAALRADGIDPYPAETRRTHAVSDAVKSFSRFAASKKKITVAGRVMALREHGGSAFADLRDATGHIQLFFKEDVLDDESYRRFCDMADIGDFVEATGVLFKTRRGEKTIEVSGWRMLSKSLRPLPEKWHGLQDVEERFRRRYLDLLMNEEVRDRFLVRSKIVKAVRDFFDSEEFIEVETPILQHIPGGALARPFRTHQNALDADLYLRVAPELYLKELLVGGFEKVYELGRSFRNEGIDVTHNPEFTTVEWYGAYWDESDMMACVERCFLRLLKVLGFKNKLTFGERIISFPKKFIRISFSELLSQHALIRDYDNESRDSLAEKARRLGVDVARHESRGKIADEIYKKICRPHLQDPVFVVRHPTDISPLAKKVSGDPLRVRRFQLVVGGLEVVNAFAELNDPLDQRERFVAQDVMRKEGQFESHPFDEDFVEAMEYGMPPAAGAAIGIDRLVMFLTNTHNIKEVILFPTMRPK